MIKLSACLIVKNESSCIRRCLASIDSLVDEIIVVDTGSVDDTIDIVKTFPKAVVYEHPWTNDFSEARNRSLALATGDWILVIDADEIIAEEDYFKLRNAIQDQNIDGYYILTKNYTNNYVRLDFVAESTAHSRSYLGWTPSHKTRIFKNKPHYRFRGRIHEVVDASILETDGRLAELDVPIHHFGADEFNQSKLALYRSLLEDKASEEPNNPMAFYELGQLLWVVGEADRAIEAFQKGIELNPNFGDMRYGNLYYEIGNVYYYAKQDQHKALESYLKAIQVRPGYLYVYSLVGSIYCKMGKLDLAEAYLQEAVLLETATPSTYHDLALVRIKQKRYREAIVQLKLVIKAAPAYVGAINNLAVCHHLLGEKEEAERVWNDGIKIDSNNYEIRENLRRHGMRIWHAAAEENEQEHHLHKIAEK